MLSLAQKNGGLVMICLSLDKVGDVFRVSERVANVLEVELQTPAFWLQLFNVKSVPLFMLRGVKLTTKIEVM